VVRKAVALAALLCAAQAHAQFASSVALLSDYRYRGVSLSDGQPAAQLSLSYDAPSSGGYAGAMVSNVRLSREDAAQVIGYAGVARRFASDWSWDVGMEYTQYTGHYSYRYAEVYAGVNYRHVGVRLYYASDYFGLGRPVLYAELNASQNLGDRWYVFGHAGVLQSNGAYEDRRRNDYRAGFGLTLDDFDLQLAWTTFRGSEYVGYPVAGGAGRDALVASVRYSW
jgi:uncharacterized protein (TIGR02001 family)